MNTSTTAAKSAATEIEELARIITEGDEKRHTQAKYDGVKVAVVMPDGTASTAPLSDYGYEQLFLNMSDEDENATADQVRGMIEAYEDAPIDEETRERAQAHYRKHERPASCVEFSDEGNAATIRVSGKAYANLAKVAAAMNSCTWTGGDNTVATVLDFLVGSFLWRTQYAPDGGESCNIIETMVDITDGIDTGYEDGTAEDAARKRELSEAFDAVKF